MSDSRLLDAINLQQIAGNPLSADDIALFEMFEREGWSHARRLRYINTLTWMRAKRSASAADPNGFIAAGVALCGDRMTRPGSAISRHDATPLSDSPPRGDHLRGPAWKPTQNS